MHIILIMVDNNYSFSYSISLAEEKSARLKILQMTQAHSIVS